MYCYISTYVISFLFHSQFSFASNSGTNPRW